MPGAGPSLLDAEHRRMTAGVVLVVSFVAFEAIGVATAMPAVLRHLGGVRLYGWAFSAFMLAQLVGTVVSGPVLDRVGLRAPLTVAAVLFCTGLLIGGTAPSMLALVLGRAVQGAGAGVLGVTVNVAVGRGYPPSLRPRAYAALSTAWVVPGVVGPLVAGVVAQDLTWRLVFLGLVPAVAAGTAVARSALRAVDRPGPGGEGAPAGAGRRSAILAVVLAAGTALVLGALGTHRLVPALVLGALGLALAGPALAGVIPGRAGRALPRLGRPVPAAGPRQLGAMVVAALANASFFGTEAFLPLALTSLHHRNLAEAGVVLTVASLSWTAGSWVQAHTVERVGPRLLSGAGLALVALGVAGVAALDWSATPWWTAFCAWGVAGGGMGLAYTTTTLVVVSGAGEGRQGGPVSAMQVLVTLGVASGAGVGGAALAWSVALGHGKAPGLRLFDGVAVLVALAGLLACSLVPRAVPPGTPAPAAPGAGASPPGAPETGRAGEGEGIGF